MDMLVAREMFQSFIESNLPSVVTRFESAENLDECRKFYEDEFNSCHGLSYAVLFRKNLSKETDAIVIFSFSSGDIANRDSFLEACLEMETEIEDREKNVSCIVNNIMSNEEP